MRISRRKRTDSGRIIPEWARRGEISLRQGGISGPVDSRLDFRIEPEGEGLVVVHFTGQTADGDLLDEVPCDEFPLGAGIHGILSLDNGSVPLFESLPAARVATPEAPVGPPPPSTPAPPEADDAVLVGD